MHTMRIVSASLQRQDENPTQSLHAIQTVHSDRQSHLLNLMVICKVMTWQLCMLLHGLRQVSPENLAVLTTVRQ